jgi:hypothetical protein
MSKESLLKKEFKHSDVQRVRNIVKKDFTAKTKLQSGYSKSHKSYKEGDIWEESGKTWTIKNGIKQNVTKLDAAKKAVRVPLACPKCGGTMKHRVHKKMYKIHGFCFDCTINYEAELRKAGLFEKYEKSMIQGNMKAFSKDLSEWVDMYVQSTQTFVTEQGVIEDWKGNAKAQNDKVLNNLKEYLAIIDDHLD